MLDFASDKVGFPNETCYKGVLWELIYLAWGADLNDNAVPHDCHPVRHRERIYLIVCDVEHCDVCSVVDLFDFVAHLLSEGGIEIANRFVKQENARFNDKGACECDALLLSTGKCVDCAIVIVYHLHHL